MNVELVIPLNLNLDLSLFTDVAWGVLVFLKFCKIQMSARSCSVCA